MKGRPALVIASAVLIGLGVFAIFEGQEFWLGGAVALLLGELLVLWFVLASHHRPSE